MSNELESDVQQHIQTQAMYHGCQLMRNNSGALKDETGRPVRYGLGNTSKAHNDRIKSSDLIGFTKVVITQDMVGKTVAIFTAVEVKKPEWQFTKKLDAKELAQKAFIDFIIKNGGKAGFANSVDNIKNIVGQ